MKSVFTERVCRSIVCRASGLMLPMMALMMTIATSAAFAQDEPLRPPTTREPPSGPKFIVMGIALLLTGLLVFAVTLRSKRGHQD